ncbi:uncharacterized protein LOC124207333 isoform X1 [Daphnia pulex]|uniref:uncharacterized protein LOC124207333 isoform X1 n=1 Tax=Daphnia pulex TaxID=6669 RepID=UPI001EDEE7B7|nr:uncharacterized protein LOC124207333 isoform X1 [Daphnia pulex]
MPKRKSPQTLVSECLKTVSCSIEWFALHHYPQFNYLSKTNQISSSPFFPELRNFYQLYFIIHFLFVIVIASDLTGQIFNRLKTIPGLSASHFQLALTDHLNEIDLSNPYQHDSWDYYIDIALGIICRRKPNLLRINLSNVLRIPDIFWTDIVPSLDYLRVISLRSTNCADQQVLTLIKHCQNLRELDLSLCERVTNWSVSNLCQESAVGIKLQLLDVMQTQVDERGIRSVVQRCTGLSSLKWRNTINALGQIYRDLASGTSTSHITTPPSYSLHQLISDSSYRLYSLQGAVQLCRQAVQVIIDGPSLLLAEELQALEHLHCLRELRVVLGSHTRSELLLEFREGFDSILTKHGSTLQHLSIGRIRHVDLERIAHSCHQLTSLSLELNHSYRETTTDTRTTIQSLSKLNVSVRDRKSNEDSHHDVPASCLAALTASPGIRHIKITASQNMSDAILSESLVGHDLDSLELESCSNISMRSLWSVIHHSKRLSNLKVYRCQLVVDSEIAELHRMIEEQRWDLDVDYYPDS